MRHLAIAALLLCACRPAEYDAYWSAPVCIEHHSETQFSNECGLSIDGHFDCNPRLRNHTVCDKYGLPRCMPGSDGVADCEPDIELPPEPPAE